MPRDVLLEQKVLERLPAEYRPLFIKCVRLIIDQPSEDESPRRTEKPADASPKWGIHST
jgi:hypothetical protein